MTAKEQSLELIKQFALHGFNKFDTDEQMYFGAKYALICVNNIIASNPHSNPFNTIVHSTMEYWIEVKREIELWMGNNNPYTSILEDAIEEMTNYMNKKMPIKGNPAQDWVKFIPDVALFKKYAQFQEEAIFDFIFTNIGTTNKFLVDFGAGGLGCNMSNSKYLLECGWTGLRMDGNPNGDETIHQEFITAENIVSLFEKYNVPKEFDLLSIDIDGLEFWVLQQMLQNGYSPRVIINEFNGCLDENACIAIKNNPTHTWNENDFYGASFQAFKKLLNGFGYTLIHQIATTNMIFVKSNLVAEQDYNISYTKNQYHPHFKEGEWVEV